ncbi:hypothetical protein C8R44DRAFT_889189 [Mycena epipterygia]|nr:hypothetical protein C8R44DRAFT_889189 [Mycena epipterygia]
MDALNGHLYLLHKLNISSRGCLDSRRVPSITANPTLSFLFVINPLNGPGARNTFDVTTDIATYAQWGAAYRPTGIFFDETTATTQLVSLYQSYANSMHSALGSTAFVRNHGVVPVDEFYTFADLAVSCEDFYSAFSTSQLTISATAPAAKQADLVKQLTGQLGIGYIYITNAEYNTVPADWANFSSNVTAAQ